MNKKVVVDDPSKDVEIEEALDFAEAMRLDDNRAGDDTINARAKRQVTECLRQAEQGWETRYTKYRKLLKLWNQESLSAQARDMSVHMGAAFEKAEEWASKMYGAIFGQAGEYVGGECEDLEDKDEAEIMVSLVQEILDEEGGLRRDGMSILREAAIFGRYTCKFVPELEIKHILTREVTAGEDLKGNPVYDFSEVEEKEIGRVKMKRYSVSPFDFRIPDTATSIDDADWCGDYSYPTPEELRMRVRAGDFDEEAVEKALSSAQSLSEDTQTGMGKGGSRGSYKSLSGNDSRHEGESADAAPTAEAVCCFEWWGQFDIDGDGKRKPCVITVLMPTDGDRPIYPQSTDVGWVVRVTRNPYLMGHKPYASLPVLPKEHRWDSPGIVELVGKHSYYEDEMAVLALLGAYHEASPALQVSDASGVDPSQLQGFIPGKVIDVEQLGQMEYLTSPVRSQAALQTVEYFSGKSAQVAGLRGTSPQPRVAAAANIMEAQEQDTRLLAYIHSAESQFIVSLARMAYAYAQQFLTTEKKVKVLGMKASRLGDMRTVKPTDLAMNLRFDPIVGKKIAQKAFQGQMAMNMYDRCQMANMMGLQTGQGPLYKMDAIGEFLWGEIFGHPDPGRFMHTQVDPSELRTVAEEHRLFAMGEKPTVQKGEKVYKHLQGHIDYLKQGGAEDWGPERRQAFVDHIYDTIDEFHRQIEAALPEQAEIVAALMQEQLGQVAGPSTQAGQSDKFERPQQQGGQSMMDGGGSRGVANPTQSVGSPMFRPERIPGLQGNSMSQTYNGGAQ